MISRIVKWYLLINKRLFRKYSFILLLGIVPLFVTGIRVFSMEESGIVRIVLCQKDPKDELAAAMIEELMADTGVLRYVTCQDEREAMELVSEHEAEAAWIFAEDMRGNLQRMAERNRCEPIVTVVEREDDVSMRFARQILINKIYSAFSYMIYESFVRENVDLDGLSDVELREAYSSTAVEGSLFQMEYLDGKREKKEQSYVLMPLRGILALWFVLCGFAASLYFMQDEQSGIFLRVSRRYRLWSAYGVHAVILSDAAAVLIIACRLSGTFTVWGRELISILLFLCSTLMFCNLIRLLCHNPERLGELFINYSAVFHNIII